MSTPTARTCPKGHKYRKTSDCPQCPKCGAAKQPSAAFLMAVGAPARRALESQGITSLKKLAKWSKADLLKLHGFGPSSLPRLEAELKKMNLSFSERKTRDQELDV